MSADPVPIAPALLAWAKCHGRHDLPWQSRGRPADPYRIWVSEIMLQQTQVATVIPYFERFIAQFPDIQALAAASQDAVLAHWSGLGYYARGRNLHRAARQVCADFGGQLPATLAELQSLPGIGRSTAGAILAFAHDQRVPILDGNVKRVLTRYHALSGWPGLPQIERQLWELADTHTPARATAAYTQAIMDLGATVCRRRPDCSACPLSGHCAANVTAMQMLYPTPKPRKSLPTRTRVFALIENAKRQILLIRRPPAGIWGGLWCLPDWPDKAACLQELNRQFADQIDGFSIPEELPTLAHSFSHYHLQLQPLQFQIGDIELQVADTPDQQWISPTEILNVGLPAPIRALLTTTYKLI